MVEKILNNTTPYGKIRASHEGSLHSSTLNDIFINYQVRSSHIKPMYYTFIVKLLKFPFEKARLIRGNG